MGVVGVLIFREFGFQCFSSFLERILRSDSELVSAVLGGEKDAFCELVVRYEVSVRAVAVNILRNHHLAQDICQESFVRAYEKLGSLRNKKAFGGWILKIARSCSLNELRKQKEKVNISALGDVPAEQRDGQLDAENSELLEVVMKLRKSERDVVMLRYFGGHTVKEVANISDRSVNSVTSLLSRARKKLRKKLKQEPYYEG